MDYPPYPRYHFYNASADIRRIFGEACDALGIEWRHNNARSISVAGGPALRFSTRSSARSAEGRNGRGFRVVRPG